MDTSLKLYYCDTHNEWYSQNCSNCMANDTESFAIKETRASLLKEIKEELEKQYSMPDCELRPLAIMVSVDNWSEYWKSKGVK